MIEFVVGDISSLSYLQLSHENPWWLGSCGTYCKSNTTISRHQRPIGTQIPIEATVFASNTLNQNPLPQISLIPLPQQSLHPVQQTVIPLARRPLQSL